MLDNALDIVKGASILTAEDMTALSGIGDELRQTWSTAQVFRTRTEMEISVLTDMKRPTPDSKYWQSVREQNVMFCQLVELSYEYRKKSVEIRKMQHGLGSEDNEFDRELKQIEIEQAQWHLVNMERTAHDRIREIMEWADIKSKLLPDMKYGTEDVNSHQLEAMKKRYYEEAKFVTENTAVADARNIIGLANMAAKDNRDRIDGGNGNGLRQVK